MNNEYNTQAVKKAKAKSETMFAFAVILSVLGIAFTISWCVRGPRIHDFSGIGQARILTMSQYTNDLKERSETVFRFDVQINAGEETFTCREKRSSKPSWKVGDVVPVTYNVKNPKEHVLGLTPEAYTKWYNTIGIVAFAFLLGGGCFFRISWKLKRFAIENEVGY